MSIDQKCEKCGEDCSLMIPAYWGFQRMGDQDYATLNCDKCGWSKDVYHGQFPKTKKHEIKDIEMHIPKIFVEDINKKTSDIAINVFRGQQ